MGWRQNGEEGWKIMGRDLLELFVRKLLVAKVDEMVGGLSDEQLARAGGVREMRFRLLSFGHCFVVDFKSPPPPHDFDCWYSEGVIVHGGTSFLVVLRVHWGFREISVGMLLGVSIPLPLVLRLDGFLEFRNVLLMYVYFLNESKE